MPLQQTFPSFTTELGKHGKKTFAAGIDFSNIGSKSLTTKANERIFPANMRLGATFTNEFDKDNSLSFSLVLNKCWYQHPRKIIQVKVPTRQ